MPATPEKHPPEVTGGPAPPPGDPPPGPGRLGALVRIPGVVVAAVGRFLAAGGSRHAAGIAYRVLFSMAPLAIVLLAVFGVVLQDDDVRGRVIDAIIDALPLDSEGGADVQRAIEAIASPASFAGLASLLAFVWAASGMMGAIRGGLEAMMGRETGRPVVRGKLVDLALVAGTGVLVLTSVAFGLVTEAATQVMGRIGDGGAVVGSLLATLFPFLLSVGTAMLLYRFVSGVRLPNLHALTGAIVTAVLLSLISFFSSLVYAHTTRWSLIYGSLASILVFLYSVFLYASALLLGAAVAAEMGQPPSDAPPEPLGIRIRKALKGLVVSERPKDAA